MKINDIILYNNKIQRNILIQYNYDGNTWLCCIKWNNFTAKDIGVYDNDLKKDNK